MSEEKKYALEIEDLNVEYHVDKEVVHALNGISFKLKKGETIGLVGETGAGKTTTGLSILRLIPSPPGVVRGTIKIQGEDIGTISERKMESIRGNVVSMIFQDPMTSLNPVKTIGDQISEVIIKHQGKSKAEAKKMAIEMMGRVGIREPEKRYNEYPFMYSGGMRQRIVIAIALACRPRILICDEPTTALDVTIQAQIIRLIKDLSQEYGFTTIYITHDLGVVANVADVVAVMYAGQIIEYGNVNEIFYDSRHPYTWGLLSSLPQLGEKGENLFAIRGTPPSLFEEIKGDAFAPRSNYALKIDYEQEPPFFKVSDTHFAKTWLMDPRAPKVEPPAAVRELHERMLALTSKGGIYGER